MILVFAGASVDTYFDVQQIPRFGLLTNSARRSDQIENFTESRYAINNDQIFVRNMINGN